MIPFELNRVTRSVCLVLKLRFLYVVEMVVDTYSSDKLTTTVFMYGFDNTCNALAVTT